MCNQPPPMELAPHGSRHTKTISPPAVLSAFCKILLYKLRMEQREQEIFVDYLGVVLGVAILLAFYFCT